MIRNKKKYNIIIFAIILIGMIAFIPSLSSNIINVNNDSKIDDTLIDNEINTKIPTLSKYISTYNDSGGAFNVTLHQSLVNTTKVRITNTSNTDNITFYEKCPTDTNFNTSLINITIEDIYAPNKSFIVEDGNPGSWPNLYANRYASHFVVASTCWLQNVSVRVWNEAGTNGNLEIQIYNSTWDGENSRSKPNKAYGPNIRVDTIDDINGWWNFTYLHKFLNVSETENNTFFIVLDDDTDNTYWGQVLDTPDPDDSWVFQEIGLNNWFIFTSGPQTVDLGLKFSVAPINSTPNPEDIGMEINNSAVTGYGNVNGSGYWRSTDEYSSSSGNLKFNISAEWWDVSCKITKVQINYTKCDILANSSFDTSGNGDDIFWNATINEIDNEIDEFETGFENKYVNFTIPSSWYLDQVFMGGIEKTNTTWDRGDGWQIVKASPGENGKFWGLNASSSNLIYSIEMHIGGIPKTTIYSSDIINFNANFTEEIGSGNANLTVYSPLSKSDFMNHTYLNITFSAGPAKIVNLSDWDVSDNVTAYGIFRVRVFWNNGTAAGFHKTNLMILSTTDLELIDPSQDDTFFTNQIFNITLYFNDTNTKSPIDNANISYNIDGQGWLWTNENNGTSGFYNITVDCSDFAHDDYGLKTVQIKANKTCYENQTLNYNFEVICLTNLNLIGPSQDDTFNTSQIFNITLYFNDINTNSPTDNVNISYNIDGQGWLWTNINNGASGYYNITVDCSNFAHDDYGSKTVQIKANKTYYENQTLNYNFEVICLTSLNLIEPSQDDTFFTNQQFNITIYFEDINKNAAIDGATIYYSIDGGIWLSTTLNNGTVGYYYITVDCSQFNHDDYGPKTVQITANKTYYENQTLDYNFSVICETDLTLASPSQYDTYYTNQSFDIDIFFEDINQIFPIDGATIYYSIDGGAWLSFAGNNGTSGYYRLNIVCGNFGPDNYGLKTVEFTANKTDYENSTLIYYFFVICLTDLNLFEPIQNDTFLEDQIFNITIYFEDINQNSPIDGANISYYIEGKGWQWTNLNNGTEGYYNITIDVSDIDFDYGYNIIIINVNKTYYSNQTFDFWFQKVIKTNITVFPEIVSVIRGTDASFQLNYSDRTNKPITNITGKVIISVISIHPSFTWTISVDGNGNYTIVLHTTYVDVGTHICTFNISATGNETQIIILTVHVYMIQTEILIVEGDYNSTLVRWQGFDQSIIFYFIICHFITQKTFFMSDEK